MGAARGLDEGLIGTSASQPSFKRLFGLDEAGGLSKHQQADRLGNITSMVQMGSIAGALIGFATTDKLGRLWATRQLCVWWVVGIIIFVCAGIKGNLGMVYAGRFIAGVGIGQTTVVGPTYLAEVAPKSIRGLCVCLFSGSVYFGIILGYFASWGSSIHISPKISLQWVIPNLMHFYFAVIIVCLSFMAVESPRWLIKVGKHDKAAKSLSKLRNLPEDHWYIQNELAEIHAQLEREQEATRGSSWLGPIRELITIPANRYRLMLSVMSQLLGQWSGASSITIYAPEYFAMMGVKGQRQKLFGTAILGVVKFVSSMLCAFILIDWIGRKRSLLTGIMLQFITMLYMALFLTINPAADEKGSHETGSQRRAAEGAIVMIYFSGFGWALGWNSIQYLLNSEIYPLRLRAIGGSFAMTFHFLNQYGNSKAVPDMFIALTDGGTMWFFAAVTAIGFFWVWFFLPELAGVSLEAVDAAFNLSWTRIGRNGKQYAQAFDQERLGQTLDQKEKSEMIERL
ncbi:general substrate transporter [Piedraia hortae CBS 480.64]|uniref:General substrate transporter n=1 Tax=Piedraia hortae CBS 480.64 TaxID=1314780 RepID=A0A6A7C041_9PEZI|nr:general substrate transporter [Piedraia hortae CBS 480.64]